MSLENEKANALTEVSDVEKSPKGASIEKERDRDTDTEAVHSANDTQGNADEGGPNDPTSTTTFEGTLEEKRLVRKLDGRIMPLACILYLFACMLSFSTIFPCHRIEMID